MNICVMLRDVSQILDHHLDGLPHLSKAFLDARPRPANSRTCKKPPAGGGFRGWWLKSEKRPGILQNNSENGYTCF